MSDAISPFGFVHCPECGTLWVNVRSALHVHLCVGRQDRTYHLGDLFLTDEELREARIRRMQKSAMRLPVHWVERVEVQP